MKNGLEYFSLDTFLDDSFALIEAEFGLTGFAVVVKLFQKIYGQQGYYCEWNKDVALLFSRQNGLGGNVVSEIVNSAIKRGIFDKGMHDKYSILTSESIQKRYLKSAQRRICINLESQYLLINDVQNYKNVNISSKNAYISGENDNNFKQSKGKKKKESKESKESKVNKTTNDGDLSSVVAAYQNNIAPIRATVRDSIIDWLNVFDADVIIWAIEYAVKMNKGKWSYVEGILRNQLNSGNKTLADITSSEKNYKKSKDTASAVGSLNDANAYDYDDIERRMWQNIKNDMKG